MDDSDRCPCLSGETYGACCGPLHRGARTAATAEALMRSRYSAFAVGDARYLLATWHPSTRPSSLELDPDQVWRRLDVLATRRRPVRRRRRGRVRRLLPRRLHRRAREAPRGQPLRARRRHVVLRRRGRRAVSGSAVERLVELQRSGTTSAEALAFFDALPIDDVFRRVDEHTVLGLMELRGMPAPFFVLRRAGAASRRGAGRRRARAGASVRPGGDARRRPRGGHDHPRDVARRSAT